MRNWGSMLAMSFEAFVCFLDRLQLGVYGEFFVIFARSLSNDILFIFLLFYYFGFSETFKMTNHKSFRFLNV